MADPCPNITKAIKSGGLLFISCGISGLRFVGLGEKENLHFRYHAKAALETALWCVDQQAGGIECRLPVYLAAGGNLDTADRWIEKNQNFSLKGKVDGEFVNPGVYHGADVPIYSALGSTFMDSFRNLSSTLRRHGIA